MKYPKFTGDEPCTQVGAEHFFLPEGQPGWMNLDRMRALCGSCVMQADCLEWAVQHEHHGFWGGTTEHERVKIRKARNILLRDSRAA